MKFEKMRNVVYLLVVCFVLFGCAGTTTETGSDRSEREYDINASNNTGTMTLNMYLDKTDTIKSDPQIKGGTVSPRTDLDVAYKQDSAVITNPDKPAVPVDPDKPALPEPPDMGEPTDPEDIVESNQYQQYRKGTVYDGYSILMMCPGDFFYKACELNGKKMKLGDDKGRQFANIKGVYEDAIIVCEKKEGGFDKFVVSLGDKGECK